MILSILRHAIAVARGSDAYPNDDRPLTSKGKARMRAATRGIVRLVDVPDRILTSPLVRARKTADIVADAFDSPKIVQETPHLLPGSSPNGVIDLLRAEDQDAHIMLVGHEPDLSSLIGLLLQAPGSAFALKKGGLAHLELDLTHSRPGGKLLWLMRPKQLRMLAKET